MNSTQSWTHAKGENCKLGSKPMPPQTFMFKMQHALQSTSRSSWSHGPCPQHPCPCLHSEGQSKAVPALPLLCNSSPGCKPPSRTCSLQLVCDWSGAAAARARQAQIIACKTGVPVYRRTPYPAATTAAAMATLPHGAGRPRNLSGSARRVKRVKGSTDSSRIQGWRAPRPKSPVAGSTKHCQRRSALVKTH